MAGRLKRHTNTARTAACPEAAEMTICLSTLESQGALKAEGGVQQLWHATLALQQQAGALLASHANPGVWLQAAKFIEHLVIMLTDISLPCIQSQLPVQTCPLACRPYRHTQPPTCHKPWTHVVLLMCCRQKRSSSPASPRSSARCMRWPSGHILAVSSWTQQRLGRMGWPNPLEAS